MKRLLIIAVLAAAVAGCARAQKGPAFDAWFVDKTLRVDYYHTGSAAAETFALDQVYDQGIWAGSRTHLIDPFDLGRYAVKVYDDATGTLIFSKGFDSYFGEYKTSDAEVVDTVERKVIQHRSPEGSRYIEFALQRVQRLVLIPESLNQVSLLVLARN